MPKAQHDGGSKWRWPRLSLRELLALVAASALMLAPAAYDTRGQDAISFVSGSLFLVWGYVSWKAVHLNPDFFTIWKRKSRD